MARAGATRTIENGLRRWGFWRVAGCDEVGRGCLAGPVVAAAVILSPDHHIKGLADSKLVPPEEREFLHERITATALAWAVAAVSPGEIDRMNIHRASLEAMRRSVLELAPLPDVVLVDAFSIPHLVVAQRGIPKGDRRCSAIAAASIVAKVTRDRQMRKYHDADPRYGYHRHKGYATPEHLAAVARFGYSKLHRRSFRPSSLVGMGLMPPPENLGCQLRRPVPGAACPCGIAGRHAVRPGSVGDTHGARGRKA